MGDQFVANSEFVRQRIMKYDRREAIVLDPPVALARFEPTASKKDCFLFLGQLVPHTRAGLAIQACNRTGHRLLVAGTGSEEPRLRAPAGQSIEFLGFVPDEKLAELHAGARALLFPGKEDFGIVPLEAMVSGTPVIALRAMGAT